MIIKEITLNNFRIYGGNNKIDLSPSGDKNIIIVSGMNGFGKTTFLMSLVWCLYGKQMEKVDEMYLKEIREKKNYGQYIVNSLNFDAQRHGISHFSVSITFTEINDSEINANSITVKRIFEKDNASADDLLILFDGKTKEEWYSQNKKERIDIEEHFIREHILPLEVAKFFFFDAEKIVAYAQSESTELGKELSDSYAQVLGIQKYVNLKNDLEKIRIEYQKTSATGQERRAYNEIDRTIEDDSSQIEELSIKLVQDDSSIEYCKKQCDDVQTLIVQQGASISEEELSKLRNQQEEYKSRMQSSQDQLKDLYNFIPFGLAGGLFAEVVEQAQKEIRFKQQAQRFDAVDEKANAVLTDLDNERLHANLHIDYPVRAFYERTIMGLIKKYFSNSEDDEEFTDFTPLLNVSEVQMESFSNVVSQVKDVKEKFLRLFSEYNKDRTELDRIMQRVRDAESAGDNPELKRLRSTKAQLDADYEEAIGVKFHTQDEIDRLKEEIKANKQQRESLGKKIKLSDGVKKYDTEISRIITILDRFIKLYKEKKIESLKKRISDKLKSFMHKTDLIESVDIITSRDDLQIVLKGYDGRIVDQSQLSMGERQLFSSAILGSLVEETSYKFPVFIDSPLQKLDIKHSNNILQQFYPTVSSQVVMFPLLHKELTPQEYELIKDRVNKIYLIKNNEKKSHFEELKDKNDLFNNY